MSEYRTGDPVCNCRESQTAGKAPCPVHDSHTPIGQTIFEIQHPPDDGRASEREPKPWVSDSGRSEVDVALDLAGLFDDPGTVIGDAIDLLASYQERLAAALAPKAEPEEPVAWIDAKDLDDLRNGTEAYAYVYTDLTTRVPLFTAPPKPEPGGVREALEQGEQPLVVDDHGVVRFRENPVVRYLLDAGPFDMNTLAVLPGISDEDRQIFAQLIGYSVSGYGDLSYAEGEPTERADRAQDALASQPAEEETYPEVPPGPGEVWIEPGTPEENEQAKEELRRMGEKP